jgi:hypothetical protein
MTAVDFLQYALSIHFTFEQKMQFEGLFQQAKEMEKQQMIDACISTNATEYESLEEACNRACNFSQQDKP